ncbi:MAG: hypothetical protein ABIH28_00005, partial [archaeon]
MVYKRYVKINGKVFGPYFYKSRRVNGVVKTEYVGSAKEEISHPVPTPIKQENFISPRKENFVSFRRVSIPNKKRTVNWAILGGIFFVLLLLAFFLNSPFHATGGTIAKLDNEYLQGEVLRGTLDLSLKQGELLPANTKVLVGLNGKQHEFLLSDIANYEISTGNYYLSDFNISGSGEGYGILGEKKVYSPVHFQLNIFEEKKLENESIETNNTQNETQNDAQNQSLEKPTEENVTSDETQASETQPAEVTISGETITPEQTTISGETSITEPTDTTEEFPVAEPATTKETKSEEKEKEKEQKSEETSKENRPSVADLKEQKTEEKSAEQPTSITGNIISFFFGGISNFFLDLVGTGKVTKDFQKTVEASASFDKPFLYEIKNKESAEIVAGSVYVLDSNGEKVSVEDSLLLIETGKKNVIVSTEYYDTEKGFGEEYLGTEETTFGIDLSKLNISAEEGLAQIKVVYGDVEIYSFSENIALIEGIINETNVTNITELPVENLTLGNVTNLSLNFSLAMPFVKINEPIKWKKRLNLTGKKDFEIDVPMDAENISVHKTKDSEEINVERFTRIPGTGEEVVPEVNITNSSEEILNISNASEAVLNDSNVSGEVLESNTSIVVNESLPATSTITGSVIYEGSGKNKKGLSKITGYATEEINASGESAYILIPQESLTENKTEIEIEFSTPGPVSFEQEVEGKKIVTVSSDLHYENVLAYTTIENYTRGNARIYWVENNTYLPVYNKEINGSDLYVEWIVPYLSNQTFDIIIEIVSAEHLDENRTF